MEDNASQPAYLVNPSFSTSSPLLFLVPASLHEYAREPCSLVDDNAVNHCTRWWSEDMLEDRITKQSRYYNCRHEHAYVATR